MIYNPFKTIKQRLKEVKKYDEDYLKKLFWVDQVISIEILAALKLNREIKTNKVFLDYEVINLLYSHFDSTFNESLLEYKTNYPSKFDNLFHELASTSCYMYDINVIQIPNIGFKLIEEYILITRNSLYKVLSKKYNFTRIVYSNKPYV